MLTITVTVQTTMCFRIVGGHFPKDLLWLKPVYFMDDQNKNVRNYSQLLLKKIYKQKRILVKSGARHSKHRSVHYCRVLPPGEFNSMSSVPLQICSVSFITITLTVFQ